MDDLVLTEKAPAAKPRKYKCNYCDRAFLRSEHRSRHERSHTKERPFRCPTCPSTFVRRDLLLRHERTVHAKKRPEKTTKVGEHMHKFDKEDLGVSSVDNGKSVSAASASATSALLSRPSGNTNANHNLVQSPNLTGYFSKLSIPMLSGGLKNSPNNGLTNGLTAYKQQDYKQDSQPGKHTESSDHYDAALAIANLQVLGKQQTSKATQTTQSPQTTATTTLPPITSSLAPLQILHHQKSSAMTGPPKAGPSADGNPSVMSSSESNINTNINHNEEHTQLSKNHCASPPGPGPSPSPLLSNGFLAPPGPSTARDEGKHHVVSPPLQIDSISGTASGAGEKIPLQPDTRQHHHPTFQQQPSNHKQENYGINSGIYGNANSNGINNHLNNKRRTPHAHIIPQFGPMDSVAPLLRHFNPELAELDNDDLCATSSSSLSTASPSKISLNRFLSAYFNFFHPALPFLHIQTFEAKDTPPALVFSICSIGALLCRDHHIATALNGSSKLLLSSIDEMNRDFPDSSQNLPIWMVQSLLLNIVFASWSNDPRFFETIRATKNRLLSASTDLVKQTCYTNQRPVLSYSVWVYNESVRRTFFAVYRVFASLHTIMNYPLAITCDDLRELNLIMPCSELIWATVFKDDDDWQTSIRQDPRPVTFNEVSEWVTHGSSKMGMGVQNESAPRLGAFALFITSLSMSLDPKLKSYHHNHRVLLQRWMELTAEELDIGWQPSISDTLKLISPMDNSSYPSILESEILSLPSGLLHTHPLIHPSVIPLLVSELEKSNIDLSSVKDTFRYHVSHDISQAAFTTLNHLMDTGSLQNDDVIPLMTTCFSLLFKGPLLCGSALNIDSFCASTGLKLQEVLAGTQLALFVIMWVYQVEQGLAEANYSGGSERDASGNGTINGDTDLSRSRPSDYSIRVFEAIEELCVECGTLDRYRTSYPASNGGTPTTANNPASAPRTSPPLSAAFGISTPVESRVSTALCMVYAELLDSISFCGFSQILSASMRDLALKFSPRRLSPNTNSSRVSRKRHSNEFTGGYVVTSSTRAPSITSPIVAPASSAAASSYYKPMASFHELSDSEIKPSVTPIGVNVNGLLEKPILG